MILIAIDYSILREAGKEMNAAIKEYIASLIPKGFQDGRDLVKEGIEIGNSFELGRNKFLQKYGYKNYLEYRKDCVSNGKMIWQLLLGLSSLEEELDAIKELDEFSNRTGLDIRTIQSIPSMLVALPHEYWENAPKPTSYLMKEEKDWFDHSDAAPIAVIWQDWHLSSPNNLKNTIYALKAGSPRIGTFSQLIWDYPGYKDEENRFSDMVRSLGIIASKRDDFITADTYPEDGLPGYFLDVASYVGYTLVEHYITEKLCGAKMSISYGGLLTEIQPRMAFGMAMHKLLGSEDEPILSYYNGGTIDQWDHDINANFGTGVQEMLIEILVELKYKMHTAISPVSVTEKLRVPTLQELFDIAAAGRRAEEKAKEWLPLMDFSPLEKMRDELIEKGTIFFNNVLDGFKEAGVDIEDPLQMIVMLKRINPVKFEEIFHPSIEEKGTFTPYHPSVLGRQTMNEKERIVKTFLINNKDKLKNCKVVAVSADGHSYGLLLVDNVLSELDATVVNGGVDMEPSSVLDLADEEGSNQILISIHCGQALDYSKQILKLAKDRGKEYHIFMGGMLNAMLPGNTEPVDVTDKLIEMGIHASNDLVHICQLVKQFDSSRNYSSILTKL
ncbi:cobalamin B12-binding domain-containing protein [Peribacillus butanolivorans]|uniref:cobalamin B12-binding domain-containing protein n=1 Tax=Peribacillus butanolivorans TaxID=421767 RepID=UPI0039FD8706